MNMWELSWLRALLKDTIVAFSHMGKHRVGRLILSGDQIRNKGWSNLPWQMSLGVINLRFKSKPSSTTWKFTTKPSTICWILRIKIWASEMTATKILLLKTLLSANVKPLQRRWNVLKKEKQTENMEALKWTDSLHGLIVYSGSSWKSSKKIMLWKHPPLTLLTLQEVSASLKQKLKGWQRNKERISIRVYYFYLMWLEA